MLSPKVLGVLAGRDLAPGALKAWLNWADLVVAADAGADLCREAGREPDVIVGDLDSISNPAGLFPDPDQNTSDADKLLAYLNEKSVNSAKIIGVEGDRLDHVLATLWSCARQRGVLCEIILRTGTARVMREGCFAGMGAKGRVSLLPLEQSLVTLSGVRWPLQSAVLEPKGLVSLSNEMVENRLDISVHKGTVVLFLETGAMPAMKGLIDSEPSEE